MRRDHNQDGHDGGPAVRTAPIIMVGTHDGGGLVADTPFGPRVVVETVVGPRAIGIPGRPLEPAGRERRARARPPIVTGPARAGLTQAARPPATEAREEGFSVTRLAELVAEHVARHEAAQRRAAVERLVASRPDFNPRMRASVADMPIEYARVLVDVLPRGPDLSVNPISVEYANTIALRGRPPVVGRGQVSRSVGPPPPRRRAADHDDDDYGPDLVVHGGREAATPAPRPSLFQSMLDFIKAAITRLRTSTTKETP